MTSFTAGPGPPAPHAYLIPFHTLAVAHGIPSPPCQPLVHSPHPCWPPTCRYRLLPQLYTLFFHANATGQPILRPLWWEFPGEEGLYAAQEAFMFGAGLLVAPALRRGAQAVEVSLPGDGVWYDGAWGRRYDAALPEQRHLVLDTSLDTPAQTFVRGGHAVTLKERCVIPRVLLRGNCGVCVGGERRARRNRLERVLTGMSGPTKGPGYQGPTPRHALPCHPIPPGLPRAPLNHAFPEPTPQATTVDRRNGARPHHPRPGLGSRRLSPRRPLRGRWPQLCLPGEWDAEVA